MAACDPSILLMNVGPNIRLYSLLNKVFYKSPLKLSAGKVSALTNANFGVYK